MPTPGFPHFYYTEPKKKLCTWDFIGITRQLFILPFKYHYMTKGRLVAIL